MLHSMPSSAKTVQGMTILTLVEDDITLLAVRSKPDDLDRRGGGGDLTKANLQLVVSTVACFLLLAWVGRFDMEMSRLQLSVGAWFLFRYPSQC